MLELDLAGATGTEEEAGLGLVVAAVVVFVEAAGSVRDGGCFTAADDGDGVEDGAGTARVGAAEEEGGWGGVGTEEGLVVSGRGGEVGVVDRGAAGVTEVGFCTRK